ncbi:MAG: hypothetical protein U5K76_16280 [Woeseiaceae bacterium]|nr:hypothetical protein [Woeseiaceae bacterium]
MNDGPGDDRLYRARLLRIAAFALIASGVFLAVFGATWAPAMLAILSGSTTGAWIELIVPFGPLVLIACGVALLPLSRR